jgi:hypothetical protein
MRAAKRVAPGSLTFVDDLESGENKSDSLAYEQSMFFGLDSPWLAAVMPNTPKLFGSQLRERENRFHLHSLEPGSEN